MLVLNTHILWYCQGCRCVASIPAEKLFVSINLLEVSLHAEALSWMRQKLLSETFGQNSISFECIVANLLNRFITSSLKIRIT